MPKTDYVRSEHHEFELAAAEAMADTGLQAILGRLNATLGVRNRQAWEAFQDSSLVRARARAIKDATLAELDKHLADLEKSVVQRGGRVYWAQDGDEACAQVTNIVRSHGATKVVKSKSMTTEEIHLNKALARESIDVVETDFGEYIIQVAGHRPSHIVGPALHLSKENVKQILDTVSQEPLVAEREALARFARQTLRARFAAAEIGITGVNFAVAETGTIVIVENEGNARLTTTLPKVHIAIMGMEKVIPRLADVPVFLKVLARAATGQKISVYTSLITGPRRAGEMDGPEEFHLIILDNGRSRILGGPLRESLFCIRCGACLNACPIYRTIGGHAYGGVYTGPIGAVLTPLYDGLRNNPHLPHASSLCGACQAACPVQIQIPNMLIKLREMLQEQPQQTSRLESWAYRLWGRTLRSPFLFGWGTWLATRTLGRWTRRNYLRWLPGKLGGWTKTRDFPVPARQRFRDWWDADQERRDAP